MISIPLIDCPAAYREACGMEERLKRRLDRLTSHREWLADTIADTEAAIRRQEEAVDEAFFRSKRAW